MVAGAEDDFTDTSVKGSADTGVAETVFGKDQLGFVVIQFGKGGVIGSLSIFQSAFGSGLLIEKSFMISLKSPPYLINSIELKYLLA